MGNLYFINGHKSKKGVPSCSGSIAIATGSISSGTVRLRAVLVVFGLMACLLFHGMAVRAQAYGDHTMPLKYSIHTYRATMGNTSNDVLWNIYDSTATRERIDGNIDLPYSKTTAYSVDAQGVDGTDAYITINFSGNLETGKKYRLAYREEGSDECYEYKFLDFVIQPPIDVDVVAVANRCPDSDLQYLEGEGPLELHTVLEYTVVLVDENYFPDGDWYFDYQILITGQSGASATIDTVRYNGNTWAQPPLQSVRSASAAISTSTHEVTFQVTINDVPGVRQRIDFKLDNIEGTYGESDIDVKVPKSGENEIFHYLDAIPAASYISALD